MSAASDLVEKAREEKGKRRESEAIIHVNARILFVLFVEDQTSLY